MTSAELVPDWSAQQSGGKVQPAALLFALALATVLGVAVYGKWNAPDSARTALDSAVIIFQPLFALALIVFHARRWMWGAAALLFASFAGYTTAAIAMGRPCGCFGTMLEPRQVLAIDLVAVAVCLFFATGASARATIGAMVTTLALAASAGAALYVVTAPPPAAKFEKAQGRTPVDKILLTEGMQDVLSSPETGPAWLVYFYNPECEICMKHLPGFQAQQKAWAADKSLRVRIVNILDHHNAYMSDPEPDDALKRGVPIWAWDPAPPITALIRGGRIDKTWAPNETPEPTVVREQVIAGTIDLSQSSHTRVGASSAASQAEIGALAVARLMASPRMADIAQPGAAGGPAWLVYVYNPECPKCLDHLTLYRQFEEQSPADANLRTRVLSMTDLQSEIGVQIYEWPGVPTTILVRNGKVVRTWDEASIPDPFEAWALEQKKK